MVAHPFNPVTQEAETDPLWIPGQPGLHNKSRPAELHNQTPSQKKKKSKTKKTNQTKKGFVSKRQKHKMYLGVKSGKNGGLKNKSS